MSKRFRFSITRDLDDRSVEWTDKETANVLTISMSNFLDEHADAAERFFTCYGMQKFLEDRTSGVDSDGKLMERSLLWGHLCHDGHEYKAPRTGGLHVVSVEIEAVANVKDVDVSVIQLKKKSIDDEVWAKIIAHPDVVAAMVTIKAAREAEVDLSDLES